MFKKSALQTLEKFTRTPAPAKRHDDNFVYARCKDNGQVQLYSRTRLGSKSATDRASSAEPASVDSSSDFCLGQFIDEVANEVRASRGKHADRAIAEFRQALMPTDGKPPRVAQLREALARLNDIHRHDEHINSPKDPTARSEYLNRKEAQIRVNGLERLLQPWLHSHLTNPAHKDLVAAGKCLKQALYAPSDSLSLQNITPDALSRLEAAGLLEKFMKMRREIAPPLRILIGPAGATASTDWLKPFDTVESLYLPQPAAAQHLRAATPQLKKAYLMHPDNPALVNNTRVPDGCELMVTQVFDH